MSISPNYNKIVKVLSKDGHTEEAKWLAKEYRESINEKLVDVRKSNRARGYRRHKPRRRM